MGPGWKPESWFSHNADNLYLTCFCVPLRRVSLATQLISSPVLFSGGITAGIISDYTGARAGTCAVMLILAAPMVRRNEPHYEKKFAYAKTKAQISCEVIA